MRTLLAGLGVAVSLAVAYIGCGLSTQGKNAGGFTEVDGGSTGTGGSGGTGPTCTGEADCPADTDCATYTCVNKKCQLELSPAGTEVAAGKVPGDCKRKVCSGNGTVSEVNADDDPPVSPNPCTTKSCDNGEIVTTIVMDNEPCGKDQYCQAGVCVGCQTASDCEAPPVCNTVECSDQQCIYTPIPEGTEVGDNSNKSDCKHTVCMGGMQETVADTTEKPPPDGEVCTEDTCNNMGKPFYMPINQGMECEPMSACADASTCENGTCTKHPKPMGFLEEDAVDGNCKSNYCDGNGNIAQMPDDTDKPTDNDPSDCIVPNCVNGNNEPMELADDAVCGPNNMRRCCNAICCGNGEVCSSLNDGGKACGQM